MSKVEEVMFDAYSIKVPAKDCPAVSLRIVPPRDKFGWEKSLPNSLIHLLKAVYYGHANALAGIYAKYRGEPCPKDIFLHFRRPQQLISRMTPFLLLGIYVEGVRGGRAMLTIENINEKRVFLQIELYFNEEGFAPIPSLPIYNGFLYEIEWLRPHDIIPKFYWVTLEVER